MLDGKLNGLSEAIIGAAIEVHRNLGPGMLECVYEECLAWQLSRNGIKVERQVSLPITYKELKIEGAFKADMIVEGQVILEIKAVEKIMPVHSAQLLSYLKMTNIPLGLLLNFNAEVLKSGIKRVANHLK